MELLLKLLLLPIWLPLKILSEQLEHSMRRSFYRRGYRRRMTRVSSAPTGCLAVAAIVILIGLVIELSVVVLQTAPWLFVAAAVGAVVVVAVIALNRNSTRVIRVAMPPPSATSASPAPSPATAHNGPGSGSRPRRKQPRICAICGAQGMDTSRVSRSDGSVSIRVCAACAERIRNADPDMSAKAMQMLGEPIRERHEEE